MPGRVHASGVLAACALGVLALALEPAPARAAADRQASSDIDAQFNRVLEDIRQGRTGAALGGVERLLERHPNFRLAHLVRGDLLLARARPIAHLGNTGHGGQERVDDLREEARARLQGYSDRPPAGYLPRQIVRLAPSQRHAVVVDASRLRVYVFGNSGDGTLRLLEDYYTTLGRNGIEKIREGDRKTPLGAYHVTSMIPGAKLPDLYGWGALPINYPNEWDRRSGKTGYGIWLHGVPGDTYARAPWASDGCIALANPDIERLAARVQPGATPVIIAERAQWLEAGRWRAEQERFAARLEQWRRDWESRDADRYLRHYAREFRAADGKSRSAWDAHKRRIFAANGAIAVELTDLSILRSPGARELVLATFEQRYRAGRTEQRSRKRLYWIEEDDGWKIAYEGAASAAQLSLPESFPAAAGVAGPSPQAGPRGNGRRR